MDDIVVISTGSIEIARFLGLFLTIIGFGFAFNSERSQRIAHSLPQNEGLQLVAGIIPAIVGSWIVSGQGQCTLNWTCVINVIGYLMVIDAFYRTWSPNHWAKTAQKIGSKVAFQVWGTINGLIGLFLLYKGWVDPS